MEQKEKIFRVFAERIKRQRLKKGVSPECVAEETGLKISFLRAVEKGERRRLNRDHIYKLAIYFDVKTDYLLGLTDKEK